MVTRVRMTFIVPASFTVNGVPQRERTPSLIECDVVELVRVPTAISWAFRRRGRRPGKWRYVAYARLPDWVIAPRRWMRLPTGEVALDVSVALNRRISWPHFAEGVDRVRIGGASTC